VLEGQDPPVTALAFSPDSQLLAAGGSRSDDVWLWSPESGEPVLLIPGAVDGCSVEALAFHPNSRLLAVGGIDWLATSGSDGAIALWDVVGRHPAGNGLKGGALDVAFHPSGNRLAAASLVQVVRVWDMTDRKLIAELDGHEDAVTCVAYSPDGRLLASGGNDRTVRLWDADTLELLAVRELDTQVKALAFAPDSRSLFTGNGNTSCYQLDVRRMLDEAL
jgi:WD40 repeat protein